MPYFNPFLFYFLLGLIKTPYSQSDMQTYDTLLQQIPYVTRRSTTSDWYKLEGGIISGCTISVILSILAINMLVKAAVVVCQSPLSMTGASQSPIRAYIDDLTVTMPSITDGRWLRKLEKL